MSRKSEPTYKTEQGIFPTRLRELMQQRGTKQKELADAIGMRPQTVSLYTTGQSAPDVNTLKTMCVFFGVSADYLLGLSEIRDPDPQIQDICKYTGLSETAISLLHTLNVGCHLSKSRDDIRPYRDSLHVLSYLLSNYEFTGILNMLHELGELTPKLNGYTWSTLNPEDTMSVPDGYHLIETPIYYNFLRYEISSSFDHLVNHFVSSLIPDIDEEGGTPNAIY